jgi:hypothetical protein
LVLTSSGNSKEEMKMKRLLIILILLSAAAAVFSAEAVVVSIVGTLDIKVPGGVWTPATVGQKISTQSMVSTGFGSRAKLSVGGMELNLQPVTRVTIDSLTETGGTPSTGLSLQTGVVRSTRPPATRTSSTGVDFRVSTPVATAAVRGTDFSVSPDKLVTAEGLVSYSAGSTVVFSPGGTLTWYKPGFGPVNPTDLAPEIWSVNPNSGSMPGDFGSGDSGSGRTAWAVITIN